MKLPPRLSPLTLASSGLDYRNVSSRTAPDVVHGDDDPLARRDGCAPPLGALPRQATLASVDLPRRGPAVHVRVARVRCLDPLVSLAFVPLESIDHSTDQVALRDVAAFSKAASSTRASQDLGLSTVVKVSSRQCRALRRERWSNCRSHFLLSARLFRLAHRSLCGALARVCPCRHSMGHVGRDGRLDRAHHGPHGWTPVRLHHGPHAQRQPELEVLDVSDLRSTRFREWSDMNLCGSEQGRAFVILCFSLPPPRVDRRAC